MADENPTPVIAVDDKEIAKLNAGYAHSSREKAMEMGWIGRFFGGAAEKPGNIAGAALFLSFAFLAAILFWGPNSPDFPKHEAVTLFGGIITGALGFLFGRTG